MYIKLEFLSKSIFVADILSVQLPYGNRLATEIAICRRNASFSDNKVKRKMPSERIEVLTVFFSVI